MFLKYLDLIKTLSKLYQDHDFISAYVDGFSLDIIKIVLA